jgi:hypothetical protein
MDFIFGRLFGGSKYTKLNWSTVLLAVGFYFGKVKFSYKIHTE